MVTIGSVPLDTGTPKICIPLVGTTLAEVMGECRLVKTKRHDVMEWRVDYFSKAGDLAAVGEALQAITCEKGQAGLLCTFRTQAEGGAQEISDHDYFELLRFLIQSGRADAVDIEYFRPADEAAGVIQLAKDRGVTVVMSSHDFLQTPPYEEITERLVAMKRRGADVAKLACMPRSPKDVLTLLAATESIKSRFPEEPLITMSMGKLGVVSRVSGETFGSAMTFGSAAKASAPGQLDADTLGTILDALHS